MTHCDAKVAPIFNRLMVFGTTDFTYHGHPNPLRCPEGMTRKSLALYYFSNGRPTEEVTGEHTTVFRARNKEEFGVTFSQRLRNLGRDLLPPIVRPPVAQELADLALTSWTFLVTLGAHPLLLSRYQVAWRSSGILRSA